MNVEIEGCRYYVRFKNDCTSYWIVKCMKKNLMFWHFFKRWSTKYTHTFIIRYIFSKMIMEVSILESFFKFFWRKNWFDMKWWHLTLLNKMGRLNRITKQSWIVFKACYITKSMPLSFWIEATHCVVCILTRTLDKQHNIKRRNFVWSMDCHKIFYNTHDFFWKSLLCPCS